MLEDAKNKYTTHVHVKFTALEYAAGVIVKHTAIRIVKQVLYTRRE